MKQLRTTSYISYNGKFLPYIRLSGKWLDKLGFRIGKEYEIIKQNDCITLKPIIITKTQTPQ